MSPLVDVTNSAEVVINDQQSKKPSSKRKNKLQKKRSLLPDRLLRSAENTSERSCGNTVNCDTNTMCNTRLNNGLGKNPRQSDFHTKEDVIETMRVPPLSTEVLSQAVEALSLGPLTIPSKSNYRFSRQRRISHKQIGKTSSGHPENTNRASAVRTPQQCGACGLEFTSLPVLTQHLAKHVYDGIYAAQWLTQAMALVTPRQSTDNTNTSLDHRVLSDSDRTVSQNSEQQSLPSDSTL